MESLKGSDIGKKENNSISSDFDACFKKSTEKFVNHIETNKISYEQLLKMMSPHSSFSEL